MPAETLTDLSLVDMEAVPIEEVALLLAREHYPELDFHPYLEHLNRYAHMARHRITGVRGGQAIAAALSRYLFEEEGFRGNRQDYYNPSNSFLNDVLDQRIGIPITLSIIYLAVGRRLELPLAGVSFPGHFLVRYDGSEQSFFVDPFNRGKLLTTVALKKRWVSLSGGTLPFRHEFLYPATNREILVRMLSNLKMIFTLQKDYRLVLDTLNKIILFTPDGTEALKERGLVYYQLECFNRALKDLESYLIKLPTSSDRPAIEAAISELKEKVEHIQ